ncbi:unnamed protein product [Withania somnifera]
MKASIKFRDEQKPLIRAKIPLTVLNFPLQSGIVSGESKELTLSLATFFEFGPSFKVAYRPNDSRNPFSFVFKTGIGQFGSPISSPFTMSAEFSSIGSQNPKFFIHVKPKFGDFCVKKSHSSSTLTKSFETPVMKRDYFGENSGFLSSSGFPADSAIAGAIENLCSGAVVSARTSVPVRNRAKVSFRWGLSFPKGPVPEDSDTVILGKAGFPSQSQGILFRHCPMLVMNKISVEHLAKNDSKKGKDLPGNVDLAQACLDLKQQMEIIQGENGLLRNALSDLRSELDSRKFNFPMNEGENSKARYFGDRRGNLEKKSSNGKTIEGDVVNDNELKKA